MGFFWHLSLSLDVSSLLRIRELNYCVKSVQQQQQQVRVINMFCLGAISLSLSLSRIETQAGNTCTLLLLRFSFLCFLCCLTSSFVCNNNNISPLFSGTPRIDVMRRKRVRKKRKLESCKDCEIFAEQKTNKRKTWYAKETFPFRYT